MNYYTIITARSSSTRLRNKIMLDITKKFKAIDILVKRSKLIGLPVVLATSNAKSDDKLVKYVKKKYKIKIFSGCIGFK
jgi:spore coat polysaccharide biosynthesis protein SpsF (cytidylyltransferase family)